MMLISGPLKLIEKQKQHSKLKCIRDEEAPSRVPLSIMRLYFFSCLMWLYSVMWFANWHIQNVWHYALARTSFANCYIFAYEIFSFV